MDIYGTLSKKEPYYQQGKTHEKGFYTDKDLRENLYELEPSKLGASLVNRVKEQAQSIACFVFEHFLIPNSEDGWKFSEDVPTLAKSIEAQKKHKAAFGEDEAFRNELSPGFGTAFLVGKRLVLTAAHCVCIPQTNQLDTKKIDRSRLVFGFYTNHKEQSTYTFDEKDIYKIETVIDHNFNKVREKLDEKANYKEWTDWALLKLDREVEGRSPLPINFSSKVAKKIQLYMLGHPCGLPMKFTKDGFVQRFDHRDFFDCNLDAFGGNSGSPVFNKETGKVVGILCEGREDYEVTDNYHGTGQRRIQAHLVTKTEIGKHGFEICQRMSILRFLVDHLDPTERKPICPVMIINSLKDNYKTNDSIPRLMHGPMSIDDIYIQLVLLEKENPKEDKKAEQKAYEEHRVNSWEDVHGLKTPIDLSKLFDKREDQRELAKRILILGRAGIGKSTLCQYMAYQWANDKLWKDKFDAVFWVPLRKLQKTHPAETSSTFLFRLCCQESSQELYSPEVAEYIQKNKNRILFILDGLDEVNLAEGSLQKKIVDELLDHPYWIITSRPHAAQSINADSMIENVGFASQTISAYIQKSFSKNAQAVIQQIRRNPIIFGLCHIPINLELVCSILAKSKGDISFIHSMTDLYEELTLTLQRRFLEQLGKENAWKLVKGHIKADPDARPVFELLESIAWIAFQQRQLLFSFASGKMEELHCQYPPSENSELLFSRICQSGFIQSTSESTEFFKNEYSFLHLTFQEFFAARYLVRLLQEGNTHLQAARLIREVKFDSRYKVVIWFIAGLLKDDVKNLNAFFEILDNPQDAIGLYSALLKVRCLEECGWSDQISGLARYEQEIQFWCNRMSIYPLRQSIAQHLVEAFEISPQGTKRVFLPVLCSCITNENLAIRQSACETLGKVGQANPQVALAALAQASEDEEIKWESIESIGQLGQVSPQLAIPLLAQICKDEEGRSKAFSTLVLVGKADPQFAIPLLEQALKDEDPEVCLWDDDVWKILPQYILPLMVYPLKHQEKGAREQAAAALGKLGREDPQLALPLLRQALKDREKNVRWAAVEALGQMEQTELHLICSWLIEVIEDDNEEESVQEAAVWSLEDLCQEDPQLIYPIIVRAIHHKRTHVRKAANYVLAKVGQVDLSLTYTLLIQSLSDKEWLVSEAAEEVFVQIGQLNLQLAIPPLIPALRDNHYTVEKVLLQLGQLDLHFAIPLLMQALGDENCNVSWRASRVIREIWEVTPHVIFPFLIDGIKNDHSQVMKEVFDILQKIGEVDLQAVLPILIQARQDDNSLIKDTAFKTLAEIEKANVEKPLLLLIEDLKNSYPSVRKKAAKEIVQMELTDPQQICSLIMEPLKNVFGSLSNEAVGALSEMGPGVLQYAVPLFIHFTHEMCYGPKDFDVREKNVSALVRIGQANPRLVIPLLTQALYENEYPSQICDIVVKLGKTDPLLTLSLFVQALKKQNSDPNYYVLEILEKIGQADPKLALPFLVQAIYVNLQAIYVNYVYHRQESLSKYDLSLYLQQDPNLLSCLFSNKNPSARRIYSVSLASTPLSSLIENYKKESPTHFKHLSAIVMKCIDENLSVVLENGCFCFHEKGQIHSVKNISDASERIFQIKKHALKYPQFLLNLSSEKEQPRICFVQ